MWLILCWLVGIPKLLFHCFLTSFLFLSILCYKIFGGQQVPSIPRAQFKEQLERQQRLFIEGGGQLRDKIKFIVMRGTRGAMRLARKENSIKNVSQQEGGGSNHPHRHHVHSNNYASIALTDQRRFYLANLAVVCVLVVASCWPTKTHCLEQVSNFSKSLLLRTDGRPVT
jgi:hypothetical protein